MLTQVTFAMVTEHDFNENENHCTFIVLLVRCALLWVVSPAQQSPVSLLLCVRTSGLCSPLFISHLPSCPLQQLSITLTLENIGGGFSGGNINK